MKLRRTIGIVCMLMSLGLMVLWETAGRQYISEERIIIAAGEIHKGELLEPSRLGIGSFRKEVLPEGAVPASSADSISGLYAARDIRRNEILTEDDACSRTQLYGEKQTVFLIPQDWIRLCSGALRKHDRVRIVHLPDLTAEGTFEVAFVRDKNGQEIGLEERPYAELSQRITGPEDVGAVEIICTEKEYFKLYELAENYRLTMEEHPEMSGCFLLIPEDIL